MFVFTLIAATTGAAGPVQEIAQQFGVDWWKFLSQCISFSVVAFVLHKFAYQPILTILAERRQKIAEGLANAQAIKKQLAEAQQQSAEVLTQANVNAQRIIDEARAAAKSLQEKESQRAIMEAEQIVNKAREATLREHAKMLADLKREVAQLVVNTTAKVAGRILSDDDQRRLSEEAGREIAA
jgi:F-type H+-transporting ATPase subunit b